MSRAQGMYVCMYAKKNVFMGSNDEVVTSTVCKGNNGGQTLRWKMYIAGINECPI